MNNTDRYAFPGTWCPPGMPPPFGLTKREYFAALAMQGLLARPNRPEYRIEGSFVVAGEAIAFANALLIELEKTK